MNYGCQIMTDILSIYRQYIGDNDRYIGKNAKKIKNPNDTSICSTRWFPSILSLIYRLCTDISAIYRRFWPIFPFSDNRMPILC